MNREMQSKLISDGTTLVKEGIGPSPSSSVEVSFDGLCEPVNPGGVGVGAFVLRENGLVMRREAVLAGIPGNPNTSNNVAEYRGIIAALEYLVSVGFRGKALIKGDSMLIINQLKGAYQVRSLNLMSLHAHAVSLLRSLKNNGAEITVKWVPREQNQDADSETRNGFLLFLQDIARDVEFKGQAPKAALKGGVNIGCNEIERRGLYLFGVPSSSSPNIYTVDLSSLTCSCPSFANKKRSCKHLVLVVNCLLNRRID